MYCQQPIRTGRRDRKFCTDKCKHAYHNAEKFAENVETHQIINLLKQNRRILKILLAEREELYVGMDLLRKRGFQFDYHTHQIISRQGNQFTLCFNYGYRLMEEGQAKLVRWRRE